MTPTRRKAHLLQLVSSSAFLVFITVVYATAVEAQRRVMLETMTSIAGGVTWVEYYPEWFFQTLALLAIAMVVIMLVTGARLLGKPFLNVDQLASKKTSLFSIALLNILFLGTSHVLSFPPFPFYRTYNAAIGSLSTFFGVSLQQFYDFSALLLVLLLALTISLRYRDARGRGLFEVTQILSLVFLPLGLEIFTFDRSEWYLHVAQLQVSYNLFQWFSNADLFFLALFTFSLTSSFSLHGALAGRNPFRERRLWEVRRRLHTRNLDIGAGSVPITQESVTLDAQRWKRPNVVSDLADGLPFADESFDSVTVLEVLEHFDSALQGAILRDVNRVLEVGGQVVVTVPYSWGPLKLAQQLTWFIRSRTTVKEYYNNKMTNGHIGLLPPRDIREKMVRAGLKVVETRRFMLYDFMVVARKVAGLG